MFGARNAWNDAHIRRAHPSPITSMVCQACRQAVSHPAPIPNPALAPEEKLSQLLAPGRDPLIGWFSFRASTPLHASMREAAVTQSLQQRQSATASAQSSGQQQQQQSQQPMLLMLISTQMEHNGATLTMQYRYSIASCCLGTNS